MTPVSHTTHTTPAPPEQVGDNVITQIGDVPNDVLVPNIFSYLGPQQLGLARLTCRRFNVLGRTTWQRRAQALCQACSKSLLSFGITPPGAEPTPEEATAFLNRTVQRIKQIQNSLPAGLRSQFSENDLVCKVGLGHMQEFLQKAYDQSLRTVFESLAHVPEDASLEESVPRIREWLQTAEAGQIQELGVFHRGLCCLPGEIGQLTALQELLLNGNQLTSLPPEIGQLTALQGLSLNDNQLASLPREIERLAALLWLNLACNRLTSLPPEIGQLTALRELHLNDNRLSSLPPEIGQLMALRQLFLDDNRLTSLPPEIGQLTALGQIFLYGNRRLTSLPPEIGQLKALWELRLDSNQITSLPPEVEHLTTTR